LVYERIEIVRGEGGEKTNKKLKGKQGLLKWVGVVADQEITSS